MIQATRPCTACRSCRSDPIATLQRYFMAMESETTGPGEPLSNQFATWHSWVTMLMLSLWQYSIGYPALADALLAALDFIF